MVLVAVVIVVLAFWTAMLVQAVHALHRHDGVAEILLQQFGEHLRQLMDAQLRRFDVRPDMRRRISSL